MTSSDIINGSNDNDAFSKIKENKNDETTKKVIDNNSLENESDNNCESREKRERSLSNGSYRRGKKKICCCHEKSISKCSNKNDKSSSSSRSKNTDTLSTASTGIIEYGSSSKNINEPFKFFIGGIPQNITNKYITEYFEKYGPVQNVVIAQDHETKRNRGFAFVTMSSHINKDKILMDSHELNGKRVDVHSSGRSRCFGFVVFTNESSVAKVLKHKRHKIYDKMVEVRKAEPKKPKMSMKRQNNKSHSKYSHPPPFMGPFPYNKESMTQWANFMYNACGVPFLFNQRFQNVPDFYSNYNYYPNSVENMQQPDYNN
ncbi:RNA-binding protein, putative [Plasmodium vinckei brucechwatti]|uniref:RNA-binding protein, putative n=1 Tax=Plasmodium vinckei brucechwatti TaxID=119398 RepID=A0A6V7S049_PLAVN|nr:RNA-binding protein, putative [Plasmodium vinckei brucechwatti]